MNDLDRLDLHCPEGHHPARNRAERRRQRFSPDAKIPPPWAVSDWSAANSASNNHPSPLQRRRLGITL